MQTRFVLALAAALLALPIVAGSAFSMGGGGNNDFDFQGSCVVNTVDLNGHFSFHFDENLTRMGPPTGFSITSWREL